MSQGQAHETTFKQILHDRLGLDPGAIRYLQGDTDRVAFGVGSFGSRSAAIAGTALVVAADKLVAKGRRIAAHLLEAAESDIEFAAGRFSVAGTDRSLDLRAVAKAAFAPDRLPRGVEPGFFESGTFSPAAITYPNGCHVCEVEVDPETGTTAIVAYTVVDDVGTVVNPLTLKGQIHGGVVQGAGQALMEQVVYERDSGQLLSASFMDYCMPRADDFCAIEVKSNPAPTPLNPLGIKGAGEAGAVGALPAVMNAVIDALAQAGAPAIDMPATGEKVWRALNEARAARG
jgi:carbon-monoxide dehydrogenase large subunit